MTPPCLDVRRRMHVYTPPGYGANSDRYPVFYLLHGSGDSDQSWSALGRAGIILDNLIAARKAKPMVLVMPAGHTAVPATPASREAFINEFMPTSCRSWRRTIASATIGPAARLPDCRWVEGRP